MTEEEVAENITEEIEDEIPEEIIEEINITELNLTENITEEVNLTINQTINLTELNLTLNQTNLTETNLTLNTTNQTEFFNWTRIIKNVYGNKSEEILMKLKVPQKLKNITDKIDDIEKNKSRFSVSSEDKDKLKLLRDQLKQEINDTYYLSEFNPNSNTINNIEFNDLQIENDTISLGIEDLNLPGSDGITVIYI